METGSVDQYLQSDAALPEQRSNNKGYLWAWGLGGLAVAAATVGGTFLYLKWDHDKKKRNKELEERKQLRQRNRESLERARDQEKVPPKNPDPNREPDFLPSASYPGRGQGFPVGEESGPSVFFDRDAFNMKRSESLRGQESVALQMDRPVSLIKSPEAIFAEVSSGKTVVLMIFREECGHCKVAKPEYLKAAARAKVPMYLLDGGSCSNELLDKFDVKGFPHILKLEPSGGMVPFPANKERIEVNFLDFANQ